MRNHEQIALNDPLDYWNYHIDQQSIVTGENQYQAAGLACAYNAVENHKALKRLEAKVLRSNYLLDQLDLIATNLNATTDLKAIGEIICKISEGLNIELGYDFIDQLRGHGLRLQELSEEIECALEEIEDEDDYSENED